MQSCLYDESPCKTLTYVLCQLRTVNSKTTPSMVSVNVKVMYVHNQMIINAISVHFQSGT